MRSIGTIWSSAPARAKDPQREVLLETQNQSVGRPAAQRASAAKRMTRAVPKIFHVVWIGDESREPVAVIDTWRRHHADWEVRVYRNAEALSGRWRFSKEIEEFHRRGRFPGAADLIRWESLLDHGGIAIDADMLCFAPLPEWLTNCALAACWDNTQPEGDLLINSFVAARPQDPVIRAVIELIGARPLVFDRWSWSRMKRKPYGEWQTTGPKPFTQVVKRMRPSHFTALPSHFFLPMRRDGTVYDGGGPVLGHQLWASTTGIADIDAESERLKRALARPE